MKTQKSKSFWQLKEELNASLNEMEMLTHKKKIASAQAEFDKARDKHNDAKRMHAKLSDMHKGAYIKDMRAKGHERKGLMSNPDTSHPSYKKHFAHKQFADKHGRAANGSFKDSHSLAMHAHDDDHMPKKHVDHAEKVHNNMVDAHNKLQAAKKASPAGKIKNVANRLKSIVKRS